MVVTVHDVELLREKLLDIFPDAIRGSVAKSYWGNGRKELHLQYWVTGDSVGGLIAHAVGDLIYLVEWDSGSSDSRKRLFAESDLTVFAERVRKEYGNEIHTITKMVGRS